MNPELVHAYLEGEIRGRLESYTRQYRWIDTNQTGRVLTSRFGLYSEAYMWNGSAILPYDVQCKRP